MENGDLFKAMLETLKEILVVLKKEQPSPPTAVHNGDFLNDLIDGVDVKSILKISESTLYRLKKSKSVHTTLIGKREYYSRAEIIQLINAFKK